jgi:hypothetical protein
MRGGRPSRAGPSLRILLVLAVALVAGGCEYLYASDPFDPDAFAPPAPLATYGSGEATIAIGTDAAMTLGRLGSGVLLDGWYGGEATWSSADGWYVRLVGASVSSGMSSFGGSLTLDRIVDGEHWTTFDPARCIITIEAADAKALRGHATCKGLRWADALSGGGMGFAEPTYIKGQDPFDAEITFEARPSSTIES